MIGYKLSVTIDVLYFLRSLFIDVNYFFNSLPNFSQFFLIVFEIFSTQLSNCKQSLSSTTDKIFNATCTTARAQLQNPICTEPFCHSLPHAFLPLFCSA